MIAKVTKRDLEQYQPLLEEIDQLEHELQEIYDASTRTTSSFSDIPRGKGKKRDLSDPVSKMVDLEALIREKRDALVKKRREIEEAIERLEPEERLLVRYRYVRCMEWRQVAAKLNRSESRTYEIHGVILTKLQSP